MEQPKTEVCPKWGIANEWKDSELVDDVCVNNENNKHAINHAGRSLSVKPPEDGAALA